MTTVDEARAKALDADEDVELGEEVTMRIRKPVGAVFAVRMPREMLTALDDRARGTDRTISEVIRAAIDAYLGGTYSTSTAICMTFDSHGNRLG